MTSERTVEIADVLCSEGRSFGFLAGFPDDRRNEQVILASQPGGRISFPCSPSQRDDRGPFELLERFVEGRPKDRGISLVALGYDLKNHVESLPLPRRSVARVPDLCAIGFDEVSRLRSEESGRLMNALIGHFNLNGQSPFASASIRALTSREQYVEEARQALEYIAAGDIYQVNLAQRFYFDFRGSSWEVFKRLYCLNPARFSFYLSTEEFDLIVCSPERLLKREGRELESRPIKGTRPRGGNAKDDRRQLRELLESPKELAELIMITDLHRNDLGRVAEYGSVKVLSKRHVHGMANVFHTESVVRATAREGTTLSMLLKAMLPGGSVTGCPKVRAMEIIDELEPCSRQFYTGAVGFIEGSGTMDLAMTIRSITIHRKSGLGWFDVGSGIVADSDPEKEYEETLHKASSIMKVLGE